MALLCAFLAVAIVAVSVHAILATEFVVGDAKRWSLNFNYQSWAKGKEFHAGNKLGKLTLNSPFALHLSRVRFFLQFWCCFRIFAFFFCFRKIKKSLNNLFHR